MPKQGSENTDGPSMYVLLTLTGHFNKLLPLAHTPSPENTEIDIGTPDC